MPDKIQAFTLSGAKILRELHTEIGISLPIFEPNIKHDDKRIFQAKAFGIRVLLIA
jgi:hypothetical protein